MSDVTSGSSHASSDPVGDVPTTAAFEYPKEPIVSYAQTHEDVLLWRALHAVTPGFYIDVGAHDPTALSVTRAFYERGWRGINVEPSPFYAEKLRKERPRDLVLEVALGDSPGQMTIYDFGDTGLSTMVKEIAEEHTTAGFRSVEFHVPVTTLAAVVDDLGDQEVHFLKIDVEGYEQQVLSGANFKKFRPRIVLIEATKPLTSIPTFGAWEPLLLEAGYHFVYFDGLNRFYVSGEHLELKRYFSVPVSTADPFRDYEVVRLSAVIAKMEHDKQHEAPRLGSSTPACDSQDAAGLLRIVEAQASDLVRLRRALLSLQTLAAQSREVETVEPQAEAQPEAAPQISHPKDSVSEWVRCTALAELARIQEAITNVIEQSRWRRLGQRLGLEKRFSWEAGRWQTDLIKPNDETLSDGGSQAEEPSVAELLLELKRLSRLVDDFRRSHWRKLGQRFGLVERLPWESSFWSEPLLIKPLPEIIPDTVAPPLPVEVKSKPSLQSHDDFVELTNRHFLKECREFATDVILDVGANTGQFAKTLRAQGYHGHIVSFEPLSQAHAALVAAAESDPLWDVADRCAIGAQDGWAEINISANSYSSSLLPMLDLHRDAAPRSEYLGKEPCRVTTLDSYIERTFSDPTILFAVKIDTQGYEAEVFAGLKRNQSRIKVVLCEMSIAPLYASAPSIGELCHLLAELNFRCVALGPEFEDPRTGELLQVNGTFVKQD